MNKLKSHKKILYTIILLFVAVVTILVVNNFFICSNVHIVDNDDSIDNWDYFQIIFERGFENKKIIIKLNNTIIFNAHYRPLPYRLYVRIYNNNKIIIYENNKINNEITKIVKLLKNNQIEIMIDNSQCIKLDMNFSFSCLILNYNNKIIGQIFEHCYNRI